MFHLLQIWTTSMPISIMIAIFKLFSHWNSEQFIFTSKWIVCSNYKQGCTFLFIKQVFNKIIQFLPCHVLLLSFGRILNHIEHFIDERCSFYSSLMDTPFFQDGRSVVNSVLVGEVLLWEIETLMYKVKNNLVPSCVSEIFTRKDNRYHLRNSDFETPRFNTICYGKHSIRYQWPLLWSKLDRKTG